MAKGKSQEPTLSSEGGEPPVKKKCPLCGATMFQGPFQRGEIINGEFVVREELYNCVGCHSVKPVDELLDH